MNKIINKTNKPVTLLLKIYNAKCLGKKVIIESKGYVEYRDEVDIIEII